MNNKQELTIVKPETLDAVAERVKYAEGKRDLIRTGVLQVNTPDNVKLLDAYYRLVANGSKNPNADSNAYAQFFSEALDMLMDHCHNQAKAMGWHDTRREDGTMIALIHSELSESLEGLRKGRADEHLPHRLSAEVELADALIRIMDFAGLKGYNIGGAVIEKLEYNRHRADHTRENRAKDGGKKW